MAALAPLAHHVHCPLGPPRALQTPSRSAVPPPAEEAEGGIYTAALALFLSLPPHASPSLRDVQFASVLSALAGSLSTYSLQLHACSCLQLWNWAQVMVFQATVNCHCRAFQSWRRIGRDASAVLHPP